MNSYPFPKDYRLLNSRQFRKVYNQGNILRSKAFVLFYLNRGEEGPARLGITVTRSFGKACRRNRVKRLIRESFRRLFKEIKPRVDLVINVRPPADRFSQNEVFEELSSSLMKAGLKRGSSRD